MAKKKIDKKVEAPVGYKGEVVIKFVDRKGKVRRVSKHNAGLPALFTFLTRALQGSDTLRYRPQLIMAYDAAGDEVFINRISYTETPQLYMNNSKVTGTANSNGILFTFMVPFGAIVTSKQSFSSLKLFNDLLETTDNKRACAEIILDTPENIDPDTNIIIYWKMMFVNEESN